MNHRYVLPFYTYNIIAEPEYFVIQCCRAHPNGRNRSINVLYRVPDIPRFALFELPTRPERVHTRQHFPGPYRRQPDIGIPSDIALPRSVARLREIRVQFHLLHCVSAVQKRPGHASADAHLSGGPCFASSNGGKTDRIIYFCFVVLRTVKYWRTTYAVKSTPSPKNTIYSAASSICPIVRLYRKPIVSNSASRNPKSTTVKTI